MKDKIRKYLPIGSALVVVFSLPMVAYITFVSFKPELPENYEVKGAHTEACPNFPYPQDAKIISEDTTLDSLIATIETQKTPKEVQEFYKTVMETGGWKVETRDIKEEVFVTEYKKDKDRVKVTSGNSQNATIATICSYLEM